MALTLCVLFAGCNASGKDGSGKDASGSGVAEPTTSPTATQATVLVIPLQCGPYGRELIAAAQTFAKAAGVRVVGGIPNSLTISAQLQLLSRASSGFVRAIVIDPLFYPPMVQVLRASHDTQVPVIVVQSPLDPINAGYAAGFVSVDRQELTKLTVGQLGRLKRQIRTVAVVSAAIPKVDNAGIKVAVMGAGVSVVELRAQLRQQLPGARVIDYRIDASDAGRALEQAAAVLRNTRTGDAIVINDALSALALQQPLLVAGARRPAVVATSLDDPVQQMMADSDVDVAIGADATSMARAAIGAAVLAATNRLDQIKNATVAIRVLDAKNSHPPLAGNCSGFG